MPRVVEANAATISEAAEQLRNGGVVAFPTETVYGLGADTLQPAALKQIYALKLRPANNPLIAHVLDSQQVRTIAREWDQRCDLLVGRFWPGPLTIVVNRSVSVPDEATAGYETIAVRSPAHPVARQLLREFGRPISAPSANRSGHVSPTSATHVADDFSHVADLLILDGGPCDVGIESVVLDMTREVPTILRPGSITAESIRECLGIPVAQSTSTHQDASPGTALSHYAPHTPLILVSAKDLLPRLHELSAESKKCAVISMQHHAIALPHRLFAMPSDADAYAARLYHTLREADAFGGDVIVLERPAAQGELWDAINNRLSRAATPS